DNLLVPQPSWSPSTTQQLRKLVAAPYLSPNDWTPRSEAYFASPLALCARRVSSAASRLLGSTSLRFALHGWQRLRPHPRMPQIYLYREPVDFRKSFRGLAAIVEQELGHNPFEGALYAFTNRRRDKIKLL
uniref:IS66 family insertion sequence element accessory protein TnpB n=1 Tax=Thiolapillus sp. TaxID=2017437 RepID=UPI003AF6D9EB